MDLLSRPRHYATQQDQRLDAPGRYQPDPEMRRYDIAYLDRDGQLRQTRRAARSIMAYEQAFCVLKQGTLITTRHGFAPIEDVLPGDEVKTGNGSFDTVLWRGSIVIQPDEAFTELTSKAFTRFTPDALGYNRPSPDLVLGHGARILHRAGGIRRVSGNDAGFFPAFDFVDGDTVLPLLPTTAFTVYQLGFAGQTSYFANGMEIESLHPGTAFDLGLRGSSLRSYLSLFPHKRSFEDFGLLETPRLRLRDLDLLD